MYVNIIKAGIVITLSHCQKASISKFSFFIIQRSCHAIYNLTILFIFYPRGRSCRCTDVTKCPSTKTLILILTPSAALPPASEN